MPPLKARVDGTNGEKGAAPRQPVSFRTFLKNGTSVEFDLLAR
jgi:hypothetical protein